MMKANLNSVSNQEALDYIMYMMVGGIFKQAECETRLKERHLFLNYKNLPAKTGQELEDVCAYFADKVLTAKLPANVLESRVEVYLNSDGKAPATISFVGINWMLEVTASYVSAHKFSVTVRYSIRNLTQLRSYTITNHSSSKNTETPSIRVKFEKGVRYTLPNAA